MGKRLLLFSILIFLMLIPFAIAANESGVDKAYSCLRGKVSGQCSSLSPEEKIFSLLVLKKCEDELLSDSKSNECWPSSDCKIKTTSQAALALNRVNEDTDKIEVWLLNQEEITQDVIWYLQIESDEKTECEISYDDSSHFINIGEDKKIDDDAGSCLDLAQGDYWLEVDSNCYGKEFAISCDEDFLITLLFKKEDSSTIHVSGATSWVSGGGTTTEKIDSFCFGEDSSCDYEGSLWATMVLDYLGNDVSSYLPYLITMADENEQYLPESFLYFLTGYDDFRSDLLAKQKNNKYWDESGDKFYDTAMALYGFYDASFKEREDSKQWLLRSGVQDEDGCWGGIRNTAFILYSIWTEKVPGKYEEGCEDNGYCMSAMGCNALNGDSLEYDCPIGYICCDTDEVLETCEEKDGEICDSDEYCSGGKTVDAFDIDYGETCCVDGVCKKSSTSSDCELNNGTCQAECGQGYVQNDEYACDNYYDVCCVEKEKEGGALWIWILIILIILVITGIIFRNKLRAFWFRIKSKFRKKPGPGRPPGFPLRPPPPYMRRRIMPRRILPSTHKPASARAPPRTKHHKELDDVLKKLKDMGK